MDHVGGVSQKFGSEFGLISDPNLDFWISNEDGNASRNGLNASVMKIGLRTWKRYGDNSQGLNSVMDKKLGCIKFPRL